MSLLSFSDGILSKLTQCSLTHSLPSRVQKLQTGGGADKSGMAVNIFAPIFLFKFAAIPFVCPPCLQSVPCALHNNATANHGDDDQEYNDDDQYFSEFFGEQRKFVMIS